MQVVIQVVLNVPDRADNGLIGDHYEELLTDLIENEIGLGKIPGAASCTVTFEECV